MMLKKILISCVLVTAASGAYAINYPNKPDFQNKKYYKGELPAPPKAVPPIADFPCVTTVFIPGPYLGFNPGLINNYNQTSSVYKAFEGTLFGGYAIVNANFYLAAEIFLQHSATLQNNRNNLNNNLNPIGLKTSLGGGISILPGVVLADSLLGYLRIGALETHFKDIAKTTAGGQVGIGLQSSVSSYWDLRAEYTYTVYQTISNLGTPRTDAFRIGFLYKFWG